MIHFTAILLNNHLLTFMFYDSITLLFAAPLYSDLSTSASLLPSDSFISSSHDDISWLRHAVLPSLPTPGVHGQGANQSTTLISGPWVNFRWGDGRGSQVGKLWYDVWLPVVGQLFSWSHLQLITGNEDSQPYSCILCLVCTLQCEDSILHYVRVERC